MSTASSFDFVDRLWRVRRPKSFVLVIEGLEPTDPTAAIAPVDYLHDILLQPEWREPFFRLIDNTGLVVCLNLDSRHESYRDVRGRSSKGRLSQGEYYHHDGCSGPTKPRFVEIRCPYQLQTRSIATAVAPHHAVVAAMVQALPPELAAMPALQPWLQAHDWSAQSIQSMTSEVLDQLQGQITRTVRRQLQAEAARTYFRAVDHLADAYFEPWQLGESRIIANAHEGRTMQHRRAYQTPHAGGVANGHLVKRWPNEELPLPGEALDVAMLASFCSEEDGVCWRSEIGSASPPT